MKTLKEILADRQNISNIPVRPARSQYSMISELIPDNDPRLGLVRGGNWVSGLTSALKGGLGAYGAIKDTQAQRAYNQALAEQEKEQEENATKLAYYRLGINPNRLDEEGYLDSVLSAKNQKNTDNIKGEFGYAMSVIQSPEFANLPAEQQKLWQDFAKTKAKGLEDVYGQAYQGALGAGMGRLQTAQDIARQEAIGSKLLEQQPTGELTAIKGSPEEVKQEEKKTQALNKLKNDFEKADMILGYIDQALNIVNRNPLTTGWHGLAFGTINPYSQAGELRSLLSSIRGNVGLKQLLETRGAGATLGAISEKEMQMLQDIMGKLEQQQSPLVLKQVLENVRQNYSNIRKNAYNVLYGGQQTGQENRPNADVLWESLGK